MPEFFRRNKLCYSLCLYLLLTVILPSYASDKETNGRFGYLAEDNSGGSVQPGADDPGFRTEPSCEIPAEKIVKALRDMLKPDGVESYTFGQSMVEIAQNQGLDRQRLIEDRTSMLLLGKNKIGTATINLFGFSGSLIAYEATSYDYCSVDSRPAWNYDSKIDVFVLVFETACAWGKNGVNKLAEGLRKKGFEVTRSESNKEYAATLLKNNGMNIFIEYTKKTDGNIYLFYYNSAGESHLKEDLKEVLEDIKSDE